MVCSQMDSSVEYHHVAENALMAFLVYDKGVIVTGPDVVQDMAGTLELGETNITRLLFDGG